MCRMSLEIDKKLVGNMFEKDMHVLNTNVFTS